MPASSRRPSEAVPTSSIRQRQQQGYRGRVAAKAGTALIGWGAGWTLLVVTLAPVAPAIRLLAGWAAAAAVIWIWAWPLWNAASWVSRIWPQAGLRLDADWLQRCADRHPTIARTREIADRVRMGVAGGALALAALAGWGPDPTLPASAGLAGLLAATGIAAGIWARLVDHLQQDRLFTSVQRWTTRSPGPRVEAGIGQGHVGQDTARP